MILSACILRGVRYLSKNLPQRYSMIGELLCKGEHDIILLQEVGGSRPKVSQNGVASLPLKLENRGTGYSATSTKVFITTCLRVTIY